MLHIQPVTRSVRAMRWPRAAAAFSTTAASRNSDLPPTAAEAEAETKTEANTPKQPRLAIRPHFPMPQRPISLGDRSAIITGGSRGIGWAIACRLALEGVSCMLVGRNEETLKQAVKALPRPPPPFKSNVKHEYMVGNVRESSLWGALFMAMPDAQILVNAAGVTQSTLLARLAPTEIHDVLDVNLVGTILGCRAAMRTWVKQRNADRCIINISSLLAVRGGYGASVYSASKAGVIGLTRALAEEGGPRKIRSNVILPGYIQTDMLRDLSAQQIDEARSRTPLGRIGAADEVADAALFLVKNSYANNCVLNIDGGLSAAS